MNYRITRFYNCLEQGISTCVPNTERMSPRFSKNVPCNRGRETEREGGGGGRKNKDRERDRETYRQTETETEQTQPCNETVEKLLEWINIEPC